MATSSIESVGQRADKARRPRGPLTTLIKAAGLTILLTVGAAAADATSPSRPPKSAPTTSLDIGPTPNSQVKYGEAVEAFYQAQIQQKENVAAYLAAMAQAEKDQRFADYLAGLVAEDAAKQAEAEQNSQPSQPTYSSGNTGMEAQVVADGSVWDRLAGCESGGDWHINTGNGFTGGLQFMDDTWLRMGGGEYAQSAYLASREQQIDIAERTLAASTWAQQWPQCSAELGLS